MKISAKIIQWYQSNARDLPWRTTFDPYLIWMSEVILQQTQVRQGLNYYHRFVEKYPRVELLAAAPPDEVLKLWQGLGYYSRARNMHAAAQTIVEKHNGRFPDKYNDILNLKGVGEYTAAAIASFAYGLPYPAIDGNMQRVVSRVFGVKTAVDTAKGKKEIKAIAQQMIKNQNPAEFNQALMEFGSLQCSAKQPACTTCPIQANCAALAENMVGELPLKSKKTKQRNRYFNYLLIELDNAIVMQQRRKKDIWQNLYELPLIETPEAVEPEMLIETKMWKQIFGSVPLNIKGVSENYLHQLSHQKLHTRFYHIEPLGENIENRIIKSPFIKVKSEKIATFAVPKLIERYFKEINLLE